MGRPIQYYSKPMGGAESMTYKDHLKKALKRGTVGGGYTEADLFQKNGDVKKKEISKYDQ